MNPKDPVFSAPHPDGPSDLELDQLALGELDPAAAARVQAAVDASPEARRRLADRRRGFAPDVDADELFARIAAGVGDGQPDPAAARAIAEALAPPAPASSSWFARLAGGWGFRSLAIAGAAAIAFLVLRVTLDVDPGDDIVTTKGSLALTVHRQTADGSEALISGATLTAGTKLRFEVDVSKDGHLLVLGIDAAGSSAQAWPQTGMASSTPIRAGKGQALPGAIALDAAPGQEWLHAVWCPAPFAPSDLTVGADAGTLTLPEGCLSAPFGWVKAP